MITRSNVGWFVCNILQMRPLQTTDVTTIETPIDQQFVTGLREAHISSLNKCKHIFNCKYKTFGHWTQTKLQMDYISKSMCLAFPKTTNNLKFR